MKLINEILNASININVNEDKEICEEIERLMLIKIFRGVINYLEKADFNSANWFPEDFSLSTQLIGDEILWDFEMIMNVHRILPILNNNKLIKPDETKNISLLFDEKTFFDPHFVTGIHRNSNCIEISHDNYEEIIRRELMHIFIQINSYIERHIPHADLWFPVHLPMRLTAYSELNLWDYEIGFRLENALAVKRSNEKSNET